MTKLLTRRLFVARNFYKLLETTLNTDVPVVHGSFQVTLLRSSSRQVDLSSSVSRFRGILLDAQLPDVA